MTDAPNDGTNDWEAAKPPSRLRRWLRPALVVLALIVLVYYPLGMWWYHRIDDNLDYALPEAALLPGGSHAVAMAAALIAREVDEREWVANDPWFKPSAALDNMPNFQQGIVSALARFAFELTDQIGRSRGSSQTDKDLQEAAGLLQTPGGKWIFDLSTSVIPTSSAEAQYRKARRSLLAYNQRLAAGQAVFERRTDNLLATLDRVALDLGSSSAALERHIAENSGGFIDWHADDLFYGVKGQSYAYYLLLRELKTDFAAVLRERDVVRVYDQMLQSMREVAGLTPLVIINGAPDSSFTPSHLAAQGFYLLRARTQLREITAILAK